MSIWWSYFWPVLAAGLTIGLITGLIAFRKARRTLALGAGLALALIAAALWHGPLGAADRFTGQVERIAQTTLDYYEMTQIEAHLLRGPLSRQLKLSGPADDFQRGELVRLFSDLPGVTRATWSSADRGLPLIAEGALSGLVGYLLGLLLAYLVALRRRYNAQWKW